MIPVYNEEKTLEKVIETIMSQDWGAEIEVIIVDDGSKDRSRDIEKQLSKKYKNISVLLNEQNIGKSQTVKRGILKTKGDYVVIQDADLEYDVSELAQIFEMIKSERFDVVYGNRFGKSNRIIYLQNFIGNHFVSIFSNIFTYPRIRVYIPDMEVCYKIAKGNIFRDVGAKIVSKSNFGFEPEVTARFSKYKLDGKNLRFGIHPISYNARTIEEGKKMKAFSDGFKAVKEIVRFNLGR